MTFNKLIILVTAFAVTVSLAQDEKAGKLELLIPYVHGGAVDVPHQDGGNHKCGFTLAAEARLNYASMSPEGKAKVNSVLTRPDLTSSIVSPSGFFRVHYDSSGTNAPRYSVNELAAALDSALGFQVKVMEFPEPAGDPGWGGDTKYDVYISDIGGYYGYTEPEVEIVAGSGRYYSYMVIDNDFSGFYTTGINAAKVTAAHELNHAIQASRYILKTNNIGYLERYFYEMTATAIEEFVFDYVNDYYGYLDGFFSSPDKPLTMHTGYDLPHWFIYLQKKYGYAIIRRQWELFRTMNGINAIELALTENNSSLSTDYTEFAAWCYFTGYRSVPGAYFEEGNRYPLIKPFSNVLMSSSSTSLNLSSRPLSIVYLKIVNKLSNANDTMYSIIINNSINRAIDSPSVYSDFNYSLYTYSVSGAFSIAGKYYAKLGGSQTNTLSFAHVLNGYYSPGGALLSELGHSYPSPYSYSKHSLRPLVIPVPGSSIETDVDFAVYDLSADKVYSGRERVFLDGAKKIRWMPADNSGKRLATGVYFYIVKTSSETGEGKFIIIN